MKLLNSLPYPGFLFRQYNPRGELCVAVTLIATYEIIDGRSLRLKEQQPAILMSDEYLDPENPPNQLIRQADFIPYKPGTDVTVLANSYAPSGKPETSWLAGIKVGDTEKLLRINGVRNWEPDGENGWAMGKAQPIKALPVSYYQAYGGLIPRTDDAIEEKDGPQDCHRFNPLGPGLLDATYSPKDQPLKAPQIEGPDAPIINWQDDYNPQGLAPIAPVWRFRQQYTGTYDETWLQTHHPFLPEDFDYRFYQCAHPDLIFVPYLKGDEVIQLANLHKDYKQIRVQLPGLNFGAMAQRESGEVERMRMALDGLHFDLFASPATLKLTWRTGFEWKPDRKAGGVAIVEVGEVPKPEEDQHSKKQQEAGNG